MKLPPPQNFSPSEKYQKSVPKFTKFDVPRHPEYNLKLKIYIEITPLQVQNLKDSFLPMLSKMENTGCHQV